MEELNKFSWWTRAAIYMIEAFRKENVLRMEKLKPHLLNLNLAGVAKEFKTLNLGLPRQVGKTTFIKVHASNEDLIVYHKGEDRENAGLLYPEVTTRTKIATIRDIEAFKNNKFKTVWLDECTRSDWANIAYMYDLLATDDPEQLFVFLHSGISYF